MSDAQITYRHYERLRVLAAKLLGLPKVVEAASLESVVTNIAVEAVLALEEFCLSHYTEDELNE
jgi:hypothetical protein